VVWGDEKGGGLGLVGLGGGGGGEAVDFVAGEDFVFLEPALRDFEGIDVVAEGAADHGFIEGLHVVDFADDAGGVDVGDGEGDEGVVHPETHRLGLGENEEHGLSVGEFGAAHESDGAGFRGVGDFGLKGGSAEAQGGLGESGLRAGEGKGGGEKNEGEQGEE
jgi:hypothetical protein